MAQAETSIYNETYAARYLSSIRTPYSQLKYTRLAQLAKAAGKQNPVVLDIGGNINGTVHGGLRTKMEAADSGIRYVPLDVSPSYFDSTFLRSIQPSVSVYGEVHGIVGDAHAMDIAPGSIDMIVLADVLEHLDRPVTALREAGRVLKDDGTLFLVLPSLYKLDTLKSADLAVRSMVDEKRSTSHVNFYDAQSVGAQLAEAGLSEPHVEGLGYLTGFPYLLWTNPKYIPDERNSRDTRESAAFKTIKSMLAVLDVDIHLQLDEIINTSDRGQNLVRQLATNPARHPLDIIYEALALHPSYQKGDALFVNTYQQLRQLVEAEKPNFNADALRASLTKVIDTNSYHFLANSVIFITGKQTQAEGQQVVTDETGITLNGAGRRKT